MRLLALDLKNIRSYRSCHVEFPDGITLLSGDIGTGKSTLLLAIEFALFGISRGELTGGALLRHGVADGTVSLSFIIAAKRYSITRTLKRTPSAVTQDNGWLETENGRQILTPSELRAKVFELLGYPLQFLSKQKNLLYRFTLYTPQEEMKSILTQDSDERLETIRRLFGIDAYRIARDNADYLMRALKEREETHQAIISRIKQEEERTAPRLGQETEFASQQELLKKERTTLTVRLQEIEKKTRKLEQERAAIQQRQQLIAMQERSRKIAENELARMREQFERKEKMRAEAQGVERNMRAAIETFTKEAGLISAADLKLQAEEIQSELERLRQDEGKILAIIDQSHKPDIAAGVTCPTCKQIVTAEHLASVHATLTAQTTAAKRKQETLAKKILQQRAALQGIQSSIDRVRQVDELKSRLATHEKTVLGYADDVAAIAEAMAAKQAEIAAQAIVSDPTLAEKLRQAEQQYLEAQTAVRRYRQQLIDTERSLARLEQELASLAEAKLRLSQLIVERNEQQALFERDSQARSWLSRQFKPFTGEVERHVLGSIHSSFDAAFRQWFSRLVDDDALAARIDHAFSPVMLQHGYEADVAYLSGGERTAVSLAYRLALVHAIHILSPNLGTAGLIMLDEPTDGFSAEQLERVRDVLREIHMEQVILVSHEQQLEGFVDHILRVRKTGEGSLVEIAA